jgi:CBS domain-containing protein
MVRNVIAVKPEDDVGRVVKLLLENDISAVPVIEDDGKVVGVVSEVDPIHREEIGTEKHHPWWVEAVMPASKLADEFAKSHGRRVNEIMTRSPITASEDASLGEIATLLERHRIKRVPIVREGRLVGIISRSNLIQALAPASSQPSIDTEHPSSNTDRTIRLNLLDRLSHQKWSHFGEINVIVKDEVVHLWGLAYSPSERKALLALAAEVPDVVGVSDEMISS